MHYFLRNDFFDSLKTRTGCILSGFCCISLLYCVKFPFLSAGFPLFKLCVVQVGVKPACREQLLVFALLDNIAVPHDQNQIRIADG